MGALTSKPYAFYSRPWELSIVNSLDLYEPLLSLIRFDLRGLDVLRVLPRIDNLNDEEWINDRIRFFYQGFNYQRLLTVKSTGYFLNNRINLILAAITVLLANSWAEITNDRFGKTYNLSSDSVFFNNLRFKEGGYRSAFPYFNSSFAYDFVQNITAKYILDLETIRVKDVFSFRWFLKSNFKSNTLVSFRKYLIESNLIESKFFSVDLFLLVDLNLRVLSPLLFLWVKQRIDAGCVLIYWGLPVMFNFPLINLGFNFKTLSLLLKGKLSFWQNLLGNIKNILCFQSSNFNLNMLKLNLNVYNTKLDLLTFFKNSQILTLENTGKYLMRDSNYEMFNALNISYRTFVFCDRKLKTKHVLKYLIKLNFFYRINAFLFGKAKPLSAFSFDLLTHSGGSGKGAYVYIPVLTSFESGGKFLSINSEGIIREAEPLNILPLNNKVGTIKNFLLSLDHFIFFFTASFNIFANLFESYVEAFTDRLFYKYSNVTFQYKCNFFPYFFLDYYPPVDIRLPIAFHYSQYDDLEEDDNKNSYFRIYYSKELCLMENQLNIQPQDISSNAFLVYRSFEGVDEYFSFFTEDIWSARLGELRKLWGYTEKKDFFYFLFCFDYVFDDLKYFDDQLFINRYFNFYNLDDAKCFNIKPEYFDAFDAFYERIVYPKYMFLKPPFDDFDDFTDSEGPYLINVDYSEIYTELNDWQLPVMYSSLVNNKTSQSLFTYNKEEDFYLRDGLTKAAPSLNIAFKRFKALQNY